MDESEAIFTGRTRVDLLSVLFPVLGDLLARLHPWWLPRHLGVIRRVVRLTLPIRLVTLDPLHGYVEPGSRVMHGRLQVANPFDTSGNGVDREVQGFD